MAAIVEWPSVAIVGSSQHMKHFCPCASAAPSEWSSWSQKSVFGHLTRGIELNSFGPEAGVRCSLGVLRNKLGEELGGCDKTVRLRVAVKFETQRMRFQCMVSDSWRKFVHQLHSGPNDRIVFGSAEFCSAYLGRVLDSQVFASSHVGEGRVVLERNVARRAAKDEGFAASNQGLDRVAIQKARGSMDITNGSNVEKAVGGDIETENSAFSDDNAEASFFTTANISTDDFEASKAVNGCLHSASVGKSSSVQFKNNTEIQVQSEVANTGLRDEDFVRRVALACDADAALAMIKEWEPERGGILSTQECSELILAALSENNVELCFSILNAMRSNPIQRRLGRSEENSVAQSWRWPQPDVSTYTTLVKGLAASLRVSDAMKTVTAVRRRGIPVGDEVPFGKVVSCPTCKTAIAVVQPQHGVQLVSCATCRYQYELMSGVVVSCHSESISTNISVIEKGLRVLPFMKRLSPAAVHSVVVRAPNGLARTHRFATDSVDIPGQQGERVTAAVAAPAYAGRDVGPIRICARTPGWEPSEPMSITNHVTDRVSSLLRAPPKTRSAAALDSSIIYPALILLASTDIASALVDPTLPRLIAVGFCTAIALGSAANMFILPRLKQLPQRTVDATAIRQRLLSQHVVLQDRLQNLTHAASNEVQLLARMCQLQNKMEAIGEPAYSARIDRVRKARNGLDDRLAARLELIDSYAKIASMIEIEVEMDIDVIAAESASPESSIAEQIERLMEVESLQKEWRIQAEANDEVERLLRSVPWLPDSA